MTVQIMFCLKIYDIYKLRLFIVWASCLSYCMHAQDRVPISRLEIHDGHVAIAVDVPGHCFNGHKWPAPFLFGAAMP